MLSEGRLSKALPIMVNGQLETKLIEQAGPIGYVESTSATRVFDEDANRCLLLQTDERPRQTRRIITTLASAYAGGEAIDTADVIQRHYAIQRMLKPYIVVVPYAPKLATAFTHSRCEARRAFPQIMSLIQASALCTNGNGRWMARADCWLVHEDYRLARRLLAVPVARQLGSRVSDGAIRFLDRLREWFGEYERFAACEAITREKENSSQSSVYGWFNELGDAGLVEKVKAASGNRAGHWRVTSANWLPRLKSQTPVSNRRPVKKNHRFPDFLPPTLLLAGGLGDRRRFVGLLPPCEKRSF